MGPWPAITVIGLMTGCALDLSGLQGAMDGDSNLDAAIGDASPDGGAPGDGGVDGGGGDAAPRDAGADDARPLDSGSCAPGPLRCEAELLVTCVGGAEATRDCAMESAFCGPDPATSMPSCVPWVCTPGERRCSGDLTAVLQCDDRGSAETTSPPCVTGCDPARGACRVVPICGLSGVTDISPGSTTRWSSCRGNAHTHEAAPGCMTWPANGGDRVFRFTLSAPSNVYLDLRDDDGTVGIDTLLYVRTECENAGSQLACSDDIPCSASDFTCTGTQVRQSRIQMMLPAGTYYAIADALVYGGFGCGQVRLVFDLR